MYSGYENIFFQPTNGKLYINTVLSLGYRLDV